MKNKEKKIKEQYEAWASTYDKDKVKIIRSDTGIELEEFVNIILDNCNLRKASAENIPSADSFYDLIACVFTIRHTDIENALVEFIRVLKPKGKVVMVDLYAPERWRSLLAKIIIPVFKLFFMRKKKMRAEKESKILH